MTIAIILKLYKQTSTFSPQNHKTCYNKLMLKGHTYSSGVFFLGMLVFGSLCLEFTAPSASASSSISMSVDTNALNVNVLPNSPNGNFASSNSMTIDITLTGPGGYTLGVSGTSIYKYYGMSLRCIAGT